VSRQRAICDRFVIFAAAIPPLREATAGEHRREQSTGESVKGSDDGSIGETLGTANLPKMSGPVATPIEAGIALRIIKGNKVQIAAGVSWSR
jgi:hypothetical protein